MRLRSPACRLKFLFAAQLIVTAFVVATIVGAALVTVTVNAQVLQQGEKPLPSVDDVASLLGQPLASVFAKCGAPGNVFVTGPKTKIPGVMVDYGKFGFEIRNQKIAGCEFWLDWPGPVFGATIGGTTDDITNEMGQPNEDIKNADGTELMVWHNKDKKTKISIAFSKKHKSTGLFLEPD